MRSGKPLILTGSLIKKVVDVVKAVDGLSFAALVGPLAKGGFSYQGLKLAIKIRDGTDKEAIMRSTAAELAFALDIPEDHVDLLDLEGSNPYLKEEVIRNGIILLDREDYKNKLMSELNAFYEGILEEEGALELPRLSELNTALLERKLDIMRSKSNFLERYVLRFDVDVIKRSPTLSRLLKDSLKSAIEAAGSICRYVVSAVGMGPATSYSEAVSICVREGVIKPEVGEALKKAMRLRNVIAQGLLMKDHVKIDYDMLYAEATALLRVLRSFEEQVIEFLRELSLQKATGRPRFR